MPSFPSFVHSPHQSANPSLTLFRQPSSSDRILLHTTDPKTRPKASKALDSRAQALQVVTRLAPALRAPEGRASVGDNEICRHSQQASKPNAASAICPMSSATTNAPPPTNGERTITCHAFFLLPHHGGRQVTANACRGNIASLPDLGHVWSVVHAWLRIFLTGPLFFFFSTRFF